MEKLVFILAIASLSVAQYVKDPKEAAILSEKRYLSNNGQFGSAYTQEDGVQFTEESDQDGNRRGAYSYIDPTGKRRTITYTAGKNGFQASGDDLPVAPEAPPAPAPVAPRAPAPQGSAPSAPRQYSVADNNEEGQYHPIYDDVDYWERQSKSRPAAPAPAPAPVQQWSAPTPAPAQWNAPAQQSWSAPAAPAPRAWSEQAAPAAPQWRAPAPAEPQWSAPAPAAPQWSAPAAPVQAAPSGRAQWSAPAAPAPAPQSWEYNTVASTEAPHRFFPPGKLDLNRSPDGFSYSFSKS
uniref:Pupal cuticle protein Edg-78E n=1 Tax=Cacopsylla melanoneura TaxID=428564 RepID=A0A8D8XBR5_9HEMI